MRLLGHRFTLTHSNAETMRGHEIWKEKNTISIFEHTRLVKLNIVTARIFFIGPSICLQFYVKFTQPGNIFHGRRLRHILPLPIVCVLMKLVYAKHWHGISRCIELTNRWTKELILMSRPKDCLRLSSLGAQMNSRWAQGVCNCDCNDYFWSIFPARANSCSNHLVQTMTHEKLFDISTLFKIKLI